ncbi:2-(hydroxymethyl)glutarate dehydrogenase [archaeon HR06]|nr:2-(hydroxymethyl)glutarate dehydrogenase [archaeon HR06]
MDKRIGFIGLGAMGGNMAKNLLKKGFKLLVYDVRESALKEVVKEGGDEANSIKEVAESCDIVLLSLPTSEVVREVCLELIKNMKKGAIIIDMSTTDIAITEEIGLKAREKGIEFLDAPVSGGPEGAKAATLTIMVGGKREIFEECYEIFKVLGKEIYYIGDVGSGQKIKLVNQILVGIHFAATAEAVFFGKSLGLDPRLIFEVISKSAGNSFIFSKSLPQIIKEDYNTGWKVRLTHKDLWLALKAGEKYNIPLPLSSLAANLHNSAMAKGFKDLDPACLIKVFEAMV